MRNRQEKIPQKVVPQFISQFSRCFMIPSGNLLHSELEGHHF